jgi:hypothetical protein
MTPGEIIAAVSVGLALAAYFAVSLRFIYRLEGRVDAMAKSLDRMQNELHGMREDLREVSVIQESVRNLTDRISRLEGRSEGRHEGRHESRNES